MAGIYIHIPFCRKACHYCNFHFSTSFQKKNELIDAILTEIRLQSDFLEGKKIETIYFGGGTPSALPASAIEKILRTLGSNHEIHPSVEITLEANPEDINLDVLKEWKSMGINRLSIGIQAFQEELLKAWNRSHTSQQANEAIALSQKAGIENISADLIYGGQNLTDEDWITNIETLIASGIPHISTYALTVETGTALFHQIEKKKVKAPDEDQSNRQYAILQQLLLQAGFLQYEISNFSKPGLVSKHNTSYWSGKHYLGLGPSAHSYNGISRQWNIANNVQYISSIQDNQLPFEKEILSPAQQYNELVMTGLRTIWGIDSLRVKALGEALVIHLNNSAAQHPDQLVKNEIGNWVLKPQYYFFADGIASDMFMME